MIYQLGAVGTYQRCNFFYLALSSDQFPMGICLIFGRIYSNWDVLEFRCLHSTLLYNKRPQTCLHYTHNCLSLGRGKNWHGTTWWQNVSAVVHYSDTRDQSTNLMNVLRTSFHPKSDMFNAFWLAPLGRLLAYLRLKYLTIRDDLLTSILPGEG